MRNPYNAQDNTEELRKKIIGLGQKSIRKSYYPELQQRLDDLERFRALVDHSPDAIFLLDMNTGRFIDANNSASRLFGRSRAQLSSMNIWDFEQNIRPSLSDMISGLDADGNQTLRTQLHVSHERRIPLEVTLRQVAFNQSNYVIAVARDITERVWIEEELRKNEIKTRALLEANPDLMLVVRDDYTIVDYKGAAGYVFLIEPEVFLGRKISDIWPRNIAAKFCRHIDLAFQTSGAQIFEYDLQIGGRRHYQEVRITVCSGSETLLVIRDITERKQMEDKLRYLGSFDSLTGWNNRAFFDQEMMRLEDPEYGSAGIMICDVDGLKLVNDTLGHLAGDNLLKETAALLSQCFPEDVCKARIGGDEFCILVPEASYEAFERYQFSIRCEVEKYNQKNPVVPLSISVGFALRSAPFTKMSNVFKEADNSMNKEKLHRIQSTKSSIVQALQKALEARDFITEGHGERLEVLAKMLGQTIGLSEGKIRDLGLFAQFHDIGKVGIPDRILFKRGGLTDEELVEMRRHSEIGHRIACSASEFHHIADWILKHHEWWNGKGYPLQLRETEIPLECRILAIADAYDAMTNDRPYRKALPAAEAVQRLREGAGTQFDPELVDVFCKNIVFQTKSFSAASDNGKVDHR